MRVFSCIVVFLLLVCFGIASAGTVEEESTEKRKRYFDQYRPNYFSIVSVNWDYDQTEEEETWKNVKLQMSYKVNIFYPEDQNFNVYFAYTQKSFWDLYRESAPFREHDFNPEVFIEWDEFKNLGHLKFGLEHESTGVAGAASRSWDRFYTEIKTRDYCPKGVTINGYLRGWIVINKDEDANPDIADHLGYFRGILVVQNNIGVSRVALEFQQKSVQLEIYCFRVPKWQGFYFYLQGWHGYGESLYTYDRKTSRISFGVALAKDLIKD